MMSLANRAAAALEDSPHMFDGQAADVMKAALAQFRSKAEEALRLVQLSEGEEALTHLVDEALPDVSAWLSKCEDEGVLSLTPHR